MQRDDNLFQICHNNWEQIVQTHPDICNNLCVFTYFYNTLVQFLDPIHHLSKRSTSGVQILSLNVEGHSECKCECAVTQRMCTLENKVLNKDHCQCKCPVVQNCTQPFQVNIRYTIFKCLKADFQSSHETPRSSLRVLASN
jgi:hypothetical protein